MGKIVIPEARDVPTMADVVIIGGGIVGTATAFYASRAGLKTLVLEMRDGLATLTTTSSLECIRAQFEEPENIAMMKVSIEVFENFAEVVGLPDYEIGLHQQGYLFHVMFSGQNRAERVDSAFGQRSTAESRIFGSWRPISGTFGLWHAWKDSEQRNRLSGDEERPGRALNIPCFSIR